VIPTPSSYVDVLRLIARVGFSGLFALSAMLAASAAVLAWGYYRTRATRVTVANHAEVTT